MAQAMRFRSFIGGEWVEAGSEVPDLNPSDLADPAGVALHVGEAEVDRAIEAAAAAAPVWARSTPQQRFDALDFVGTEILARREELGRLLAREEGKTLAESIGEVVRAGHIFKFFAGEALRLGGELVPSVRAGVEVAMRREPVGVAALITPWNFPIAIPAWKTAPALAFGNAVVLKPAELVPGCAWALAEIVSRAGLPAGAFNLVLARGAVAGPRFVESRKVDAISFTGSVATGQRLAAECGLRLKRLQLEMGGKNPLVVLDDADLGVAVGAAINGAFHSTGQRCTASSRLIVTEGIHDRFVAACIEAMKALRVGHALDPATQIGPVVDERQLEQDLAYLRIAAEEGGHIAWGGRRVVRETEGYFLEPALVAGTTNAMRINREEVFGPVASVVRVKDYDEALAVANDTEFGLSAGICTTSLRHATHFRQNAQAGMVMVNLPTAGVDYHVPFGGRKGSSHGPREQGRYAAEFYTVVKTAYVAA